MAEGLSIFSPPKTPATNPSPAVVERNVAPVKSAAQVAGTQSHEPTSPAQKLWSDQRARADTALGIVDPATSMIVRQPDGTLAVKARTDGGVNGVPQPEGQPQPQPGQAVVADGKLVVGDIELTSDEVKGLMERHALEQSRKATLPATADRYQLTLPADFKMPDGVGWSFDVDHPVQGPLLARAREFAHASGMSQDQFSQMLSFHVANEVQQQQVFNRAKAAEVDKLGSLGPSRIDAVRAWVHGMVGDAAPQLLRVLEAAPIASTIVAFEKLMSRWTSQGIGGNPGAARDGASSQPPKISDADYAKLSYHEKMQYAERFQQSNGGGAR
jgi:hypothetical protein